MIVIVPKWMENKVPQEVIAYCWLYIILQSDGRGFVYKDRFGRQRFIEKAEVVELVSYYQNSDVYGALVSLKGKVESLI